MWEVVGTSNAVGLGSGRSIGAVFRKDSNAQEVVKRTGIVTRKVISVLSNSVTSLLVSRGTTLYDQVDKSR